MNKVSKFYWPAILWAIFIFIMCSVKFSDNITHAPMFFAGFDKLVHCGFFLVLVVFYMYGFIRQQNLRYIPYKQGVIVLVTVLFYGGLIEILQYYFFTWRSAEWGDFFADTIGALMGCFSILFTGLAYVKK